MGFLIGLLCVLLALSMFLLIAVILLQEGKGGGLAEAFAQRAHEIADAEGLNGRPVSSYVNLAKRCKNNFRQMLQRIEAGQMLDCEDDNP